MGLLLDRKSISRRLHSIDCPLPNGLRRPHLEVLDHGYAGRVWFCIFCGILDAIWQTMAYWLMGAMSNDPSKLAFFAGLYKSIQSAGAAGIWRADAVKIPYMNVFISEWALLVGGLVFALPMAILRTKNHTDLDDEIITRMDDQGHIHPNEAVAAEMKATHDFMLVILSPLKK